ncbi:MAG TPA: nuclear transport factor 2 family protein [Solirubrobacterales bacterium]
MAADQTDVEKLQALYREWGSGDFSRGDLFHPEISTETFGMGEPMKGENLDEFIAHMRTWLSAWERPLKIEAEEFSASGTRVLVLVHWTGRGKGSGVEIEGRGAHLWSFRDGLAIRFDTYRDRDEARAALERG